MAVFVLATFGIFFHLRSVMGDLSDLDLPRSEDPEFTRFLQTHVVADPKIGPIPWISVDFGGASHRSSSNNHLSYAGFEILLTFHFGGQQTLL